MSPGLKRPTFAAALAVGLALTLLLVLNDIGSVRRGPPAPAPLQTTLGPARVVPRGLLGFNGEAVTGGRGVWSDPGFAGALAALRPGALRVFGGTPANYWDWRTGTFVRGPLLTAHLRAVRRQAHVPLSDWARIIRVTHATPVFDLNLLTSDLPSQLAMLRAARGLGMPVRRVELGNELYLPVYATRFRDGAAYGRVATAWIAAIRRRFPGVSAAADAFPGGDTNTVRIDDRERRWNREMLRTLRGESALSFHAYFRSGLADGAYPASSGAAQRMLSAPGRRWAELTRAIGRLPRGVDAWVTEWNLFDTRARVHGTWAQGLAVAAFGLDLLTAPRVVQADYHALVNNEMFGAVFKTGSPPGGSPVGATGSGPGGSGFGLYAGGVAMQALLGALAAARSAQTISLSSGASSEIAGAKFTGPGGASAVMLNLSAAAATVAVPRALRGLPYTERWAAPDTLVGGLGTLRARAGYTEGALRLEPFSLARIGGAP